MNSCQSLNLLEKESTSEVNPNPEEPPNVLPLEMPISLLKELSILPIEPIDPIELMD